MIKVICRYVLILGLTTLAWAWNGEIRLLFHGDFVASAKAVVGRPATAPAADL